MRARTTKRAAIVVGTAALLALGYARLHRAAPRDASGATTSDASPRRLPALAWPAGVRRVYDVRWTAESRASLPGVAAPVEGSARIEAELSLGALGEVDGRTILAARIGRVTSHALRILGGDALPTDDDTRRTFEGREAFVSVAADGSFDAIYFAKGGPSTFAHVMSAMVATMQVQLAGGERAAWEAHEANANGAATVRYEVTSLDPPVLAKSRARYDALFALPSCDGCAQVLDDHGRVALDASGALRAVDDDESLAVTREGAAALASRSAFHASWLRDEAFDAPTTVTLDRAALDVRHPGRLEATEAAAAPPSIDRDDVLQGIRFYDTASRVDGSFVARAKALVVARPELCADLADLVADEATGARGRALALDVLASAETGPAQAAMRRALASRAAQRDRSAYVMLLQRFAVLEAPQRESVRFVQEVHRAARARGDREARDAAAYTLGTMAKAAARGDDASLARASVAELRRALGDATTAADRVAYLTALGNAGDPADVAAIRAYAASDDPAIRAATANALRGATPRDARDALLGLVADDDAQVQAVALSALEAQPVSPADFAAVTSQVTGGDVAPSNEAGLVTFVAKHAATSPEEARAALLALLATARARGDRPLMTRIKVLLAGV